MSHQFFRNNACEYFPCHQGVETEEFNCLFCFCPLYSLGDRCGGDFSFLPNGTKDCSSCAIPHRKGSGYNYILKKLKG